MLLDAEARDRIVRRISAVMRERDVPGAALAIVGHGRPVWQHGFGVKNAATAAPVDEHTVFEAASVSKTVFAYAVLKLCERGTLDLDTPLTGYSKTRFVDGDPRLDQITARHVLSHTSGFPEWRSGPSLKIAAEPGTRFHYSGEGYHYLQSVLTDLIGERFATPCGRYEGDFKVCATDFEATMRRLVLAPLGLTSSGYLWRETSAPTVAHPHDLAGRPLPIGKPHAADIARYGAAGELRTTVADYSRFLLAVLDRRPDEDFLGARWCDEMLRPQVKLDPNAKIDGADSWALGWAVQQRPTGPVILHSGGQRGYRSLTMASPERRAGFVIFTNSDAGGYVCFDEELAALLAPLLTG